VSPIRRWTLRQHRERIVDPHDRYLAERIRTIQAIPGCVGFTATRAIQRGAWELEWTERVEEA
jgi:hypothetical protein